MTDIAAKRSFIQQMLGEQPDDKKQSDEEKRSDEKQSDEEERSDEEEQSSMTAVSRIAGALSELSILTPFPRDLMLRRFSLKELLNLACVSDECFILVKNHLRTTPILSVKPLCNKICISHLPCVLGHGRCKHRTIRTLMALENYIKIGLMEINTLYVQATTQPINPHNAIYMVDRMADIFKNKLRYVITDVSKESVYVDCLKRLLLNNESSLIQFNVRSKKRDKSLLHFKQFKDRTQWGVSERSVYNNLKRDKKRRRKFKRFGRPHRKARFERRLHLRRDA